MNASPDSQCRLRKSLTPDFEPNMADPKSQIARWPDSPMNRWPASLAFLLSFHQHRREESLTITKVGHGSNSCDGKRIDRCQLPRKGTPGVAVSGTYGLEQGKVGAVRDPPLRELARWPGIVRSSGKVQRGKLAGGKRPQVAALPSFARMPAGKHPPSGVGLLRTLGLSVSWLPPPAYCLLLSFRFEESPSFSTRGEKSALAFPEFPAWGPARFGSLGDGLPGFWLASISLSTCSTSRIKSRALGVQITVLIQAPHQEGGEDVQGWPKSAWATRIGEIRGCGPSSTRLWWLTGGATRASASHFLLG